jgi:hypothetical protein
MNSHEKSFDQILDRMETSLNLVQEMESLLKEIAIGVRQPPRRDAHAPGIPVRVVSTRAG